MSWCTIARVVQHLRWLWLGRLAERQIEQTWLYAHVLKGSRLILLRRDLLLIIGVLALGEGVQVKELGRVLYGGLHDILPVFWYLTISYRVWMIRLAWAKGVWTRCFKTKLFIKHCSFLACLRPGVRMLLFRGFSDCFNAKCLCILKRSVVVFCPKRLCQRLVIADFPTV